MASLARSVSSCVLVSALLGAAACARQSTEGEVHIALVPKGTTNEFLNRLAAPEGQVVATSQAVPGAAEDVVVAQKAGEKLWIVEGPLPADALKGEMARIGGFAIVSLPEGADAHEALGTHFNYAEPVAERATITEGSETPRFSVNAFASDNEFVKSIDIDPAFLEQKLKEFSGAVPVTVGTRTFTITERKSEQGRKDARAWLRAQYEALGYTVTDIEYGSLFSKGTNLTAERTGKDPSKYLVLSAHLDNVGYAGADDDGAGTISALAVATALKDYQLKYNLRVVAFDQEESGLVGSTAYAKYLNDHNAYGGWLGDINLEMTAYDSDDDGGYHVIDCGENTSADLTGLIDRVVARDTLQLDHVAACTNRSDHASFWRYNKPAIVISENFFGGDENPCYHRSCDKVDGLNWNYMTKITTAVARATAGFMASK